MIKVIFKLPCEVEDSLLKYAVIVPRCGSSFVFARKRGFDTWEIPGGHREAGEDINDTARRELYEETGITDATLTQVNVYGVVRGDEVTYGMLYFAEVNELAAPPEEWEMEETRLFDSLPKDLTYPDIQTDMFWRVQGHLCTTTSADEIWDVYDEHRQKTGRLHRRGDPMPKGDYHLVVHIWLLNSRGEFLLTKRAPTKGFPGMWECTGGSALAGDDSLTAALREMEEETGLSLDPTCGKCVLNHGCADNFCDIWVFRQDFDLSEVILQPGETVDAKYATKAEIYRMHRDGELVPFDYLDRLFADIDNREERI
ncbi:MAG: NUDIX domain-containing protein [Ruminococcaceae bacterium]|nr:NUDIX domain-containing protein [Oscillospiraceae bacterium]